MRRARKVWKQKVEEKDRQKKQSKDNEKMRADMERGMAGPWCSLTSFLSSGVAVKFDC